MNKQIATEHIARLSELGRSDLREYHTYASALPDEDLSLTDSQINLCLAINGNRRKSNHKLSIYDYFLELSIPLFSVTLENEYHKIVPLYVFSLTDIMCRIQTEKLWRLLYRK